MTNSHLIGEALATEMIARGGHVHMVGCCGIGMAGVAFLLSNKGLCVSGCDVAPNRQADWLSASGIAVDTPQSDSHVDETVDWLIRTSAVSAEHAEIKAARERGIPISRRGEVLAALSMGNGSIAVAGTHGKTTTSTLIAQLLKATGRDPSWCIGGESDLLGAVAGVGNGSALVVEADESDGTLALYHPDVAVVTNVEFDHMEHFESEQVLEACFATFIEQARRAVIYCGDDARASRLCSGNSHARSYGFGEHVDLRGELLELDNGAEALQVFQNGSSIGSLTLPIAGRHNALNTLAAIGVCLELGVTLSEVEKAMSKVSLPKRRYEIVAESTGVRVVSDYAHHPSEISALVQMARRLHAGRILAVFQPHRYTRTRALGADFAKAFDGLDALVLCPVYAASEEPVLGGESCDLYAHIRAAGGEPPLLARSLAQAWNYLRRELRSGDLLLVVGAGDVESIAQWAREALTSGADGLKPDLGGLSELLSADSTVTEDDPLGRRTMYGVGGTADIWVELGSVSDLATTLRWCHEQNCPFQILGAGSNVLVSDLGVRGVVARLSAATFKQIRIETGDVVVGGAVSLAKLMDWVTQHALTGIEFLEGVPGGVGGIVRMNGGAYGHEIRERLSWIRGLNRDGSECMLHASALQWSYRGCKSLENVVVIEVGLQLEPGQQSSILATRKDICERRAWMRGLRCSGSVFRNPPGQYAGRLIEGLGLKESRIGGVQVYPRHGNFLVADQEATASDVLALIQRVQASVEAEAGVALKREVLFLE
jgi:UDP-N-acetylmuramate--alanine ligase